ncbi:MAG: hypothetical protein WD691_07995 [Acidimicrobiales bacterium]
MLYEVGDHVATITLNRPHRETRMDTPVIGIATEGLLSFMEERGSGFRGR